MSKHLNCLAMNGRLVRDVQLSYLPSQVAVAEGAIANNDQWGEKETVCYLDFKMFGKGAEAVAKYATKGRFVGLSGRITQERWEDKQGGKRSKHVLNVRDFEFLDAPGGERESKAEDQTDEGPPPVDDDKIPF